MLITIGYCKSTNFLCSFFTFGKVLTDWMIEWFVPLAGVLCHYQLYLLFYRHTRGWPVFHTIARSGLQSVLPRDTLTQKKPCCIKWGLSPGPPGSKSYIVTLSHTGPLINPFPHNDTFWCPWETNLLKTLWEKEKLLVMSNFSFSHSFLYPFW